MSSEIFGGRPVRMSQEEKDRSHARIIASASRIFRERGLEGASVADVMKDAGMTHGGFYKHFESKDALVGSALESALACFAGQLEAGDPSRAYSAYRDLYLSDGHLANPGIGCPVPALGSEVARQTEDARAVFGRGMGRIVAAIARAMRGSAAARRAAAWREFSMLVGAVVIARAADPQIASEVLAAARGDKPHGH
jgi:TetR/AcrR family transcriptional regulator, transcriptional repressor for nem operon